MYVPYCVSFPSSFSTNLGGDNHLFRSLAFLDGNSGDVDLYSFNILEIEGFVFFCE